jgi:hypothetical protein
VTLTLSASNPTAGDPVLDMAFSNDGNTFGAWQPFAPSAPYALPGGDGARTVYVKTATAREPSRRCAAPASRWTRRRRTPRRAWPGRW